MHVQHPIPIAFSTAWRTASRFWASRFASGSSSSSTSRASCASKALADAVGATQQNVSRHLALLYDDRIVERGHEGRQVWYRLADRSALALLDDVGAQVVNELRDLTRPDDDGRSDGAATAAG
jgi:DNA-binding transcriptional ArsR family regulator